MKKQPKKWKMAILVWIAIYPAITMFMIVSGSILEQINWMPLRTLVVTVIIVPLMVFLIIPVLQHVFLKWLES